MADIVCPEVRSRMMSSIRGKDTKPELIIRGGLHRKGFRFRLHDRRLPGHPDLVLKRYHAVIFVHGCFWHRHNCKLFRWPSTRAEFWMMKLNGNVERDRQNVLQLLATGWRVCVVWECALKGQSEEMIEKVIERCTEWLLSDDSYLAIGQDIQGNMSFDSGL
jgi:DNA mismatch endonuclease (patch repair protein)